MRKIARLARLGQWLPATLAYSCVVTHLTFGLAGPTSLSGTPVNPADEIRKAIEQLDADSFSARRAASDKLFLLGREAIPELSETLTNGSPESRTRALEILRRHAIGENQDTRTLALERLSQIAKDGSQKLSVEARNILNAQGIRTGQINAPVPAVAGLPAVRGPIANRIMIRSGPGFREIEFEDNQRKVKIHEGQNNELKAEVTNKQAGEAMPRKLAAKTPAELQKEDDAVFRIYQLYQRKPVQNDPNAQNGPTQLANQIRAINEYEKRLALREEDFLRRLSSASTPNEVESANRELQAIQQQRQQIRDVARRIRLAGGQGFE